MPTVPTPSPVAEARPYWGWLEANRRSDGLLHLVRGYAVGHRDAPRMGVFRKAEVEAQGGMVLQEFLLTPEEALVLHGLRA